MAEDEKARTMMEKVIASGKALDKFADFVEAQGWQKGTGLSSAVIGKSSNYRDHHRTGRWICRSF